MLFPNRWAIFQYQLTPPDGPVAAQTLSTNVSESHRCHVATPRTLHAETANTSARAPKYSEGSHTRSPAEKMSSQCVLMGNRWPDTFGHTVSTKRQGATQKAYGS